MLDMKYTSLTGAKQGRILLTTVSEIAALPSLCLNENIRTKESLIHDLEVGLYTYLGSRQGFNVMLLNFLSIFFFFFFFFCIRGRDQRVV